MAISTFEADEIVARANVNQRINQANAYFPVSVANGGTGKTSLTSGSILLGNGTSGITSTSYLSVSKGGTGQTSLTSGNILLGNGTSGITSTAILPQTKGGTGVNDFCETGSWTPAYVGSISPTYTSRKGFYARIMDMVYISFYMKFSLPSWSDGTLRSLNIKGVPFTALYSSSSYNGGYALSLATLSNNIFTTTEDRQAVIYSSTVGIQNISGTGLQYLKSTGITIEILCSGWYKKA